MNQSLFPFTDFTGTRLPQSEPAARDEALARVAENAGEDWRTSALAVLAELPDELTGEDIRLACLAAGVEPHHHNAWGSFICSLVREGVLVATGEYRPMRSPGSHARKTAVYRRS
jgi:hypothetical protein